ncbi:5-methyltetrahydropteroyltriglutamate--homocysteine S-methyltransferase [Aestuariivirga sp.]|uniref:5-methyltetrahydropteroyltriglutamate-- homocysteine S-methyltransferase n=1 Tax=Aestuariivirga sp. TaxID=2650926 RepID=UPI0039E36205
MTSPKIPTATLGVPRIGPHRELKTALESFWSGKTAEAQLQDSAKALRAAAWKDQQARGITKIPSNTFSLYDHVLDTAVMVGAIPETYAWTGGGTVPLDTYFAMARGTQGTARSGCGHSHEEGNGLPALEMTKWFDTNYHYMVPEFSGEQSFSLASLKPVEEFLEAKALGIHTRPVILGPVTFLKLGKPHRVYTDTLSLLPKLLPVYAELLSRLKSAGADWVQIDEPALALDLSPLEKAAFRTAYAELAKAAPGLQMMLASYFGGLGDNLETALSLPVAGLHLDLVRAPEQLRDVVTKARKDLVLSVGVIDGRNVWRADLKAICDRLTGDLGDWPRAQIELAPSCSLLHVPVDLDLETALDPEVKPWLAFAAQKMDELVALADALSGGSRFSEKLVAQSSAAIAARKASTKVHDTNVAERLRGVTPWMAARANSFADRQKAQHKRFDLPLFPTTTIGSFPQTADVRKARAALAKGEMTKEAYEAFLRQQTADAVRWQEEIGLDVLVHGEFERNDMVQYFGEQLAGFAFTHNGWVQSYGSRCVRPPIIYGDVSRPHPMTVSTWAYAQSLTAKPMKGMLTGPVTILNWSFVRDDIPRADVCRQIALAIRDEVGDLEKAGAAMIQIDEAALREGLPLRRSDWKVYLDWAVECFRLASSPVTDQTQIHTHMCYSEFNDIFEAITAMDADVISIETSRSRMELLDVFEDNSYPNEIGPGVYDIHSPRVPDVAQIVELVKLAQQHLSDSQIWINPDCGLKTRRWEEVRPALVNMVAAARQLRQSPVRRRA